MLKRSVATLVVKTNCAAPENRSGQSTWFPAIAAKAMLKTLPILTGVQVISKILGMNLSSVTMTCWVLPRSHHHKDLTNIIDGAGERPRSKHACSIRNQDRRNPHPTTTKNKTARTRCQNAACAVNPRRRHVRSELKERKDRVTMPLKRRTRTAVQRSIVVVGLHWFQAGKSSKTDRRQRRTQNVVQPSSQSARSGLCVNCMKRWLTSVVPQNSRKATTKFVFNLQTENMATCSSWCYRPLPKVVRTALQDAASVASADHNRKPWLPTKPSKDASAGASDMVHGGHRRMSKNHARGVHALC